MANFDPNPKQQFKMNEVRQRKKKVTVWTDQERNKQNLQQFQAAARDYGVPGLLVTRVTDFSGSSPTNESRIVRCLFALAELAVAQAGYQGPPLVLPSADNMANNAALVDSFTRRLAPSLSSSRRTASQRQAIVAAAKAGATPAAAAAAAPAPPLSRGRAPSDAAAKAALAAAARDSDSAAAAAAAATVSAVVARSAAASAAVPEDPAARVQACLSTLSAADLARLVMAIRRLQQAVRATRKRLAEEQRERAQTFRSRVANEILTSEREYVKALEDCSRYYGKPLRLDKKVLTKEQVTEIFSPVFETIVLLSRTLLSDLELRMVQWSPEQQLGDIFLKIVDFLKVYVGYIENFDTSIRTRQELAKSKKFTKLLESCVASKEVQPIASYLIMPVQRLPRYIMLLRELSRYTPPTHKDAPLLAQAIEKVSAVTEFVNEKKRVAEQLMLLLAMQDAIKPDATRWNAFAMRGRSLTKLGMLECLSLAPTLEQQGEKDTAAALMLCEDVVMLLKGNVDALQDVARSADAVRFGRGGRGKGSSSSTANIFGGVSDSVCVLQRETRTVDLRPAPESAGTAVTARDVELIGVSGDVLATLRCAHVAERDAWINVFKTTRRRLVEQGALMQAMLADTQQVLETQHKQHEGEGASPASPLISSPLPAPGDTMPRAAQPRGISIASQLANIVQSSSAKGSERTGSPAGLPSATPVVSGADAMHMLSTLTRTKHAHRMSADLTKLKAARQRLDAVSQQMASLRTQVETIEVQLLLDDQQAKGKKMKKAQRTNLERIAASMRVDLDVTIADVDVLSEHVAQLAQSIATSSTRVAAAPTATATTSVKADVLAATAEMKIAAPPTKAASKEELIKAGAVLEKRESLIRNRSRRRSAEEVPREPPVSSVSAPRHPIVRRTAEKQLMRASVPITSSPFRDAVETAHLGSSDSCVPATPLSPAPDRTSLSSSPSKPPVPTSKPPVPSSKPPQQLSSQKKSRHKSTAD